MHEELTSIMALQECMENLGLSCSEAPTQEAHAQVINGDGQRMPGTITITFHCNQYSHRGPHIEMGDAIKGYGLHYNEFKPQFQKFDFFATGKLLTITGEGYKFTLKFDRNI